MLITVFIKLESEGDFKQQTFKNDSHANEDEEYFDGLNEKNDVSQLLIDNEFKLKHNDSKVVIVTFPKVNIKEFYLDTYKLGGQ